MLISQKQMSFHKVIVIIFDLLILICFVQRHRLYNEHFLSRIYNMNVMNVFDLQDQSTSGRLERNSSRGQRYFYKSHTPWRHHKNQVFPRSEHFSPFCMFHCVQPFHATLHASRDT